MTWSGGDAKAFGKNFREMVISFLCAVVCLMLQKKRTQRKLLSVAPALVVVIAVAFPAAAAHRPDVRVEIRPAADLARVGVSVGL